MKITDEVAVFWDYENCPAPTNTSGYAIVNNIRSVAQNFGSVKLFKAYLEVTEQALVSRAVALRSELQSSGVSLTDCPHNGRKDVADKMILVDMLTHAIDNPAPSTIVLISGDRDFAYALSTLRLRHYRIILITPSNAHQSLKAQASRCFDWVSDILESVDSTSGLSHQPTSPCHGKTSFPPAPDKFYSDLKDLNPPRSPFQSESCDDKFSASSNEFRNYLQDGTRRTEPSRTPSKRDAIPDFLPPDLEQSKRQPAVSSVASDALRNEPEFPSKDTPLTMTACGSNSSKTTLTPTTSAESIMTSRPSAHSALRESAKPLNIAQHEAPMSIDKAMRMLRAEANLRESSPPSQPQDAHPPINTKTQSLSSVDQMADDDPDSPLAYLGISPSACVTATAPAPFFKTSSSLNHATVSAVAQRPVTGANSRQHPFFPVPDKFKILIRCLKTHRSRGSLRSLRSKIASEIAHNGTIYQLAGVLDFGEYVAMAEKATIVELGGSESTAWIALKAPWYNARLS